MSMDADIVEKSQVVTRTSHDLPLVGRFREVLADPRSRSRVTNAVELLAGIDGRSALARRYKDILAQIIVDQGDTGISETQMQLIRRFSATCIMAEAIEAELVEGRKVNVKKHALLSSTLVRLARRIGVNLQAKTIGPSLGAYLAERDPADSEGSP
jgi:hypothetical protein